LRLSTWAFSIAIERAFAKLKVFLRAARRCTSSSAGGASIRQRAALCGNGFDAVCELITLVTAPFTQTECTDSGRIPDTASLQNYEKRLSADGNVH
jgi:hypothetical protein